MRVSRFSLVRHVTVSLLLALAVSGVSLAGDLAEPGSEVILVVSGDIDAAGETGAARFDLAALEALGTASFTTSTIWTKGEIEFSGIPLPRLLDGLGIRDGKIGLQAINDYYIEIPVSEARQSAGLIATRLNGEPMSIREKGPLWLVYPYDSDARFRSESYYSRSIWQIERIVFYR